MKHLKITNDSMELEIIENKKSTFKNAYTDIFENLNFKTTFDIGTFEAYYSYIKNKLGKSAIESCKVVLSSDLCLSKKIPLYDITQKNNLNLSSNLDDIGNISNKLINSDLITTYYCENDIDILTACLFHFVSNGYLVRQCSNCKKWFLTKDRRSKYCDRTNDKNMTCLQQHNSQRELNRRKDPAIALDKKIRDRLDKRSSDEINIYIAEYDKVKSKCNEVEMLNWLKEQDKKYLKRKTGGAK